MRLRWCPRCSNKLNGCWFSLGRDCLACGFHGESADYCDWSTRTLTDLDSLTLPIFLPWKISLFFGVQWKAAAAAGKGRQTNNEHCTHSLIGSVNYVILCDVWLWAWYETEPFVRGIWSLIVFVCISVRYFYSFRTSNDLHRDPNWWQNRSNLAPNLDPYIYLSKVFSNSIADGLMIIERANHWSWLDAITIR